jgi:3'-phosphoadenosine 5'-phosphosulfate (PAPS) 3'-phosphatase
MAYADLIRGTKQNITHGKSYEWDTAAQDAILRTIGTRIMEQASGMPLTYNKAQDKFYNPPVIARI